MEEKQKIEKPGWVLEVEMLPIPLQQTCGQMASACLQNLFLLNAISPRLVNAIYSEVCKLETTE